MRKLIVCGLLVALAVGVTVAGARPPATNGQIAFARFNPALGDTQVYVVDPDGTHERLVQGQADTGECPKWFSDGAHIALCGSPVGLSRIIEPDDGTYRDVGQPDPDLFNPCGIPSPDGNLLLCETFSEDGSQNGIHVIRSSDGGGLRQITSSPGGDDNPGSWSPDGHRIVFERHAAGPEGSGESLGLFVVNLNGTGLRQITTAGSWPDWTPQRNEIVFSKQATANARSSIWVVHADGSGLHEVHVQAEPACGGAFSDSASQGCFQPSWSPDGTKIVFSRGTSGDFNSNLCIVNADGSDFVQITHDTSAEAPDWGTHPLSG